MNNVETISKIIVALRGLFKEKDRLVGVDDWDTFIGILMLLEQLVKAYGSKKKTTKPRGDEAWQIKL